MNTHQILYKAFKEKNEQIIAPVLTSR
jgi:hypothetical protein